MEKGRIAALDAGRAIAVVGVVAVHLSFQFPNLPHSVALIARMGQYGVQLFFVISAITIFMTLEADRERAFTQPAVAGNIADLDLMQTRRRSRLRNEALQASGEIEIEARTFLSSFGG